MYIHVYTHDYVCIYMYNRDHKYGVLDCMVKHSGCVGLARIVYLHRKFSDFPAKSTVCTPYIYFGQP